MPLSDNVVKRLADIYYDPRNAASFGSIYRLFKEARSEGITVTQAQVKAFLQSQATYTKHRSVKRNFKRNPIHTTGPADTWFADLHSIENLQWQNRRKRFLLVIIDAFSNFIYCQAIKNKSGPVVLDAFKQIVAEAAGETPSKLVTDQGVEFVNHQFQNYLKEHNIHFIPAKPPLKASMAEQAGKLIKQKIWRYMTANKTKKFIRVLPQLVESLNSRKMKSLGGLAPNEVSPENQTEVYYKKYGRYLGKSSLKSEFSAGQKVRLAKKRDTFAKGYWSGYSDEIYTIQRVIPHYPREKYRLTDQMGNLIQGTFYSEELTLVLSDHQQQLL